MATYAKGTAVAVDKTQAEIRKEVQRFGASHFSFAEGPGYGQIDFVVGKETEARWIRFRLALPNKSDNRFWRTPHHGYARSAQDAHKSWEQACRESWRALLLLVKAKLAGVSAGITTVEEEFLAHTVDPITDTTVYQQIGKQLVERISRAHIGGPASNGHAPLRLSGPSEAREPDEIIDP
jgi:hypothetical protein